MLFFLLFVVFTQQGVLAAETVGGRGRSSANFEMRCFKPLLSIELQPKQIDASRRRSISASPTAPASSMRLSPRLETSLSDDVVDTTEEPLSPSNSLGEGGKGQAYSTLLFWSFNLAALFFKSIILFPLLISSIYFLSFTSQASNHALYFEPNHVYCSLVSFSSAVILYFAFWSTGFENYGIPSNMYYGKLFRISYSNLTTFYALFYGGQLFKRMPIIVLGKFSRNSPVQRLSKVVDRIVSFVCIYGGYIVGNILVVFVIIYAPCVVDYLPYILSAVSLAFVAFDKSILHSLPDFTTFFSTFS